MSSINDFNQTVIEEFRANKGVVGGGFAGAPVVLLHTTGAKSGSARVNPLVAPPRDDGTLSVFASANGSPKDPDWYLNLLNLVAHPHVEVEFGGETFGATASPVTGDERDRLYAEQAVRMPGFAD